MKRATYILILAFTALLQSNIEAPIYGVKQRVQWQQYAQCSTQYRTLWDHRTQLYYIETPTGFVVQFTIKSDYYSYIALRALNNNAK
jgi:hypothetical protein